MEMPGDEGHMSCLAGMSLNRTRISVWLPIVVFGSVLLLSLSEGTAGISGSHGESFSADVVADSHQHGSHAEIARQHNFGGRSYSLFMHHTAGYLVLAIGILFVIERSTHSRQRQMRYGIGVMWALFGLFIFVRADPDGWPMGSGFWESWTMPTHVEWLQHKLLSLIPFILAPYAFHRPAIGHGNWGVYVAGGLAVIGAFGLLSHQHLDHPGLDVVNMQHRFFAGTCLLIAFSLLQEARGRWVGNSKKLIFPTLLILLSLQLVWYTE